MMTEMMKGRNAANGGRERERSKVTLTRDRIEQSGHEPAPFMHTETRRRRKDVRQSPRQNETSRPGAPDQRQHSGDDKTEDVNGS